jgi:hypothetical protein
MRNNRQAGRDFIIARKLLLEVGAQDELKVACRRAEKVWFSHSLPVFREIVFSDAGDAGQTAFSHRVPIGSLSSDLYDLERGES